MIFKILRGFVVLFSLIICFSVFVSTQPIVPFNIDGFVFLDNGVGAPDGVPVIVNNTYTGEVFFTEVSAPSVPGFEGFYSLAITASSGDEVLVRAFNDSFYGETFRVLSGSSEEINVSLDIVRPPEVVVNISEPVDNFEVSSYSDFNVSVELSSLVSDSENCDVELFISNTDSMDVKGSDSLFVTLIPESEIVDVVFELESFGFGSSDLEVSVFCESDDVVFEGNNKDTVFDVEVIPDTPPNVTLIDPENESVEMADNEIVFSYLVEDYSSIDECRLFINDSLNKTVFDVSSGVVQEFVVNLSNGFYTWFVECDNPFLTGSSSIFDLFVEVHPPQVVSVSVPDVVNLNPGSTKEVTCDVLVEDGNGAGDISSVEAFFHLEGIGDFSLDDKFVYYDECDLVSTFGDIGEFSCSFDLLHYASNGSWVCNVTSFDAQGLSGSGFNLSFVDELYAINLSSFNLDYGEIPAGDVSEEVSLDVFNVGNMPVSVFVRGYGGSDPLEGSGFALFCDNDVDIPVGNSRFSTVEGVPFESKSVLSSDFSIIFEDLEKQSSSELVSQSTFWELLAPPSEVADCEGMIVFSVNG